MWLVGCECVWAKEDAYGTNLDDGSSPDGGPELIFDFPYGQMLMLFHMYAATTNLFYMNNVMHDVWYQYGFVKLMGNFQTIMNVVEQEEIMSMLKLKMDACCEQKC
jgi:hypothetical protein